MAFEVTTEDGIIIFTFNNPKVNAINAETIKGIDEAVEKLNNDESLKGLILTGAGRFFSGGFDLNTFTTFTGSDEILSWFTYEENVLLKLFTCKKPVIAAINGTATAAGMIYSMAADYRIAVDHPKIKVGMTEIKLGMSLAPAMGNVMRFGLDTDRNYRDIIMKGELVDPAFCVERGIFDELTTAEELMDKAKAKIVALYDTPLHPFVDLKFLQKRSMAALIKKELEEYDWSMMANTFLDETIKKILSKVLASIS
ncbi:MAG TPA: enoyl-CoA hydratase/isomerase family protein [Spirochaetota bacterium]|nr:enoyl-CoA hydratase/isomerase family protein [Spirochaetota bacterium]HPJ40145.1 enoyl-CoA hydratase/isomerase family protein [Spirochaetota bacterium]HPQ52189.1 enoyl-CoA hydratase/isomerase family protein [Spirochaetota bacterium]